MEAEEEVSSWRHPLQLLLPTLTPASAQLPCFATLCLLSVPVMAALGTSSLSCPLCLHLPWGLCTCRILLASVDTRVLALPCMCPYPGPGRELWRLEAGGGVALARAAVLGVLGNSGGPCG